MDPYIGKFLDDRYEILDVLGTGGMAVVYRAYCHRLNRYVAVKIMKSELAADEDLRRRFHDESQSVAMLSHPNIMAVYDVSQVDGREFIVMELIDGITLKQYMCKRGGCLNWREALHFITQIMQGLRHAHSRGIIHRDIKPQNVMVLRDGSIKVTDFGIARSTTSQTTMTQETIGSVHYISPEQAKGSHIDARSDIYSAGIVLYEMLTGRLPYEGDTPVSVALQHINSIPIPPRELNSEIPLGMEQITLHAMEASLDRRYANANEMLQDLESFRKNPDIDFGYVAFGTVAAAAVDEPTIVHLDTNNSDDPDATVRDIYGHGSSASFDNEKENDEEEDEIKEKKKRRSFIIVTICIAAALLILLLILFFFLFRDSSKKDGEAISYQVPNLVGSTVEGADALIVLDEDIAGHFILSIGEYEASEEYEEGIILAQSPSAGSSVSEDTNVITVTVSSGLPEPDQITLENYAGQDYRLVKNALDELGLSSTFEAEYSDTVEEGMVIRTDPVAGSSVREGDQISIFYSQGPEVKTVVMGALVGLTESDAKNWISSQGLTLGKVSSEYSNDYAEGKVSYQSIPQNTEVELGTTVNLTISLGAEPVEEAETVPTEEQAAVVVPSHTITVTLPADRDYDCMVEIDVNGSILYREMVASNVNEVTKLYEGDINSISVWLDEDQYTNFNIS